MKERGEIEESSVPPISSPSPSIRLDPNKNEQQGQYENKIKHDDTNEFFNNKGLK